MKNLGRNFLSLVICCEIIFQPFLIYAAPSARIQSAQTAPEEVPQYVVQDVLKLVGQTRRTTNLKTGEVTEYDLSRAEVRNDYLAAPIDLSLLHFEVVENSSSQNSAVTELHIIYKTVGFEYRHIIRNFNTFTAAPKFYPDGNHLFAATVDGLFDVPLAVFREALFSAPVPVLHMGFVDGAGGEKIVDVQVARTLTQSALEEAAREKAYQIFLEKPILLNDSTILDEDVVSARDIVLQIKKQNGETRTAIYDRDSYNNEIAKRLSLIRLLAMIYDPDAKHEADLQNIQKAYDNEVSQLKLNYVAEVEKLSPDRQDLVVLALDQMQRIEGSSKGLLMATPNAQGQSVLTTLAHQERDQFTVGEIKEKWDKFSQERQKILTKSEVKQKGALKGIAAAFFVRGIHALRKQFAVENLKKMAVTTKNILGKTADTISWTLAKATPIGVMAVGAKLYAPEPTAYIVNMALSGISEFGTLLAAKMSQYSHVFVDQWVHLGIATVSLVFLLNIAVAVNALTMQSNRTRNWAPYQKFFKRLTNYFSTLNYPVSALIWEKIFKQQLMYGAIDHGYFPKDLPVDSQTGLPLSQHRRNATPAEIDAQAQKINSYIELQSAQKRANYLRALGEVSEAEKVDVATLALAAQSRVVADEMKKENIPQEIIDEISLKTILNDGRTWETMNQELTVGYKDLIKDHMPSASSSRQLVNPQTLETLRKHFKRVAESVKSKQIDAGIIRNLWSASKQFMSTKAHPFFVYGSGARKFSQQFGASSEPSARVSQNAGSAVRGDFWISFGAIGPITLTSDYDGFGKLMVASFDPGPLQQLSHADMLKSPYAADLAGEQIALAGTMYVGAALDTSSENLAEPGNQPRALSLFARGDASKEQKEIAREMAAGLIGGVYERAGLSYTPEDLKFNERQVGVKDSLSVIRNSFVRKVDADGHVINPGWVRYIDRSLMQIKRLVGDTIQGQLINNTLWMSLLMMGGIAVNQVFGANPIDLGSLSGALEMSKSVAGGVASGFMVAFGILLIKYTLAGYAYLWGPVHEMSYALADAVANDRGQTIKALTLIETGSRTNDFQMQRQGAGILLELIQASKTKDQIKIVTDQNQNLDLSPGSNIHYSAKEIAVLFKYFMNYAPVATKANHFVHDYLVNMGLGAIGTTTIAFMLTYKYIAGGVSEAFAKEGWVAGMSLAAQVDIIGLGALAAHVLLFSYLRPGAFKEKVNASVARAFKRSYERLNQLYSASATTVATTSGKVRSSCKAILSGIQNIQKK